MSGERVAYTLYHPRWIRPRMSTYWWMERASYFAFILRELSSVFVAWFVVYLLWLVCAVSQGELAYRDFLRWSASPGILVLNLVSFFFLLFHTITWFNVAPQAIVAHVAGRRVPGILIAASHFVAWAIVSAVVAWLLVG